jgi:hypothetical protein
MKQAPIRRARLFDARGRRARQGSGVPSAPRRALTVLPLAVLMFDVHHPSCRAPPSSEQRDRGEDEPISEVLIGLELHRFNCFDGGKLIGWRRGVYSWLAGDLYRRTVLPVAH